MCASRVEGGGWEQPGFRGKGGRGTEERGGREGPGQEETPRGGGRRGGGAERDSEGSRGGMQKPHKGAGDLDHKGAGDLDDGVGQEGVEAERLHRRQHVLAVAHVAALCQPRRGLPARRGTARVNFPGRGQPDVR